MLIFFYFKPARSKEGRLIQHYRNAEIINPSKKVEFSEDWFESTYQVVIYTTYTGQYSILNFDWKSAIDENPDFKFIFYYSGRNISDLNEWIKKNQWEHPILLDKGKIFYNANVNSKVSSIAYLVKNNRIIKLSNPSIPSFHNDLEHLKKLD
jgi:hypothetical protein